LRRLKGSGHAIVYISHFLEEVKEIADRFIVLRDGRSVAAGRIADVSTNEIISLMVGRQITDLYQRSKRICGKPVLEIDRVSGLEKPQNASLTLHKGEIVGIAGLVGSGRTSLFRTIFGLDVVKNGTVRIGMINTTAHPKLRWGREWVSSAKIVRVKDWPLI
jgi:ribose transport system ATP-binding protein